jgi:type IX secretion system substrate protein/VCBS repeat protein/FG-GAP repeat protein
MKNLVTLSVFVCLNVFSFSESFSQNRNEILVKSVDSETQFAFPWAGGMNSCQFGEIELNGDGIKDLLVFDRIGNRILPFLNLGIKDSIAYSFAPEYSQGFPELFDWVILVDYNQDGRNDIFTYAKGFAGMLVFQNLSNNGELKFKQMVSPFLTSFQGGGYTNILVTYADYPAIVDLDEDGDLDILTFWGLGSFVEMHQNLSIEKYGNADSLDFEKVKFCWGNFAESDESNHIYLDTCNDDRNELGIRKDRHTGSTFFVHDLNADGAKDLVLGDVDYPGLVLLQNGGTSVDANMISQNWDFPSETKKVNLFSMPVLAYLDLNNDGLKDLMASPSDPGTYISGNKKSSWLYLNSGENNKPDFHFVDDQFLQKDMIDLGSGAYPEFLDFDGDGLMDMIVGNYGYYDSSWYDSWLTLNSSFTSKLALFRNIGTIDQPAFSFYDPDFGGLSDLSLRGLVPTFGDLDGDGDPDLLLGNQDGDLIYYKNVANRTDTIELVFVEKTFQGINVGDYSSPQLFDINNDNLLDLVVGEKKGNLNYYENSGTAEVPVFTFVTDSFGFVRVTDLNTSNYGYSVPKVFQHAGHMNLIVGSEQGELFFYKDIGLNLSGHFEESDSLAFLIDTANFTFASGLRSAAAIADLDADGFLDLVMGNMSGGMNYYSRGNAVVHPSIDERKNETQIWIYPNPAKGFVWVKSEAALENAEIRLYNVFGGLVQKRQFSGTEFRIDISALAKGIYFVNIEIEDEGRTVQKLVVE